MAHFPSHVTCLLCGEVNFSFCVYMCALFSFTFLFLSCWYSADINKNLTFELCRVAYHHDLFEEVHSHGAVFRENLIGNSSGIAQNDTNVALEHGEVVIGVTLKNPQNTLRCTSGRVHTERQTCPSELKVLNHLRAWDLRQS